MPPYGYVTSPAASVGGVFVVDSATNTLFGSPIYTNSGSNAAWGIGVTPDNTHVYFSTGAGQTVIPYNIMTATLGSPIALPANAYGLAIMPDGSRLYVCCDDTNVYPVTIPGGVVGAAITGIAGSFPFTSDINICITPDGTQAFVTNHNDVIQFYTATNVPTFAFAASPVGSIYGVAASPDGTQILATALAGQIVVWSPLSNSVVTRVGLSTPGPTTGIAIQPSGLLAYTNAEGGSQGQAFVLATDTAGALYNITGGGTNVGTNVAFAPNSSTVYFCDGNDGLEPMATPSNVLGTPIAAITGPQNMAFGPAVVPPVVTFPKLFIPRKGFAKYEERDYGINFRVIERWANNL